MKNQSENLPPPPIPNLLSIPVSIDQIMYWLPYDYEIACDQWSGDAPVPQKCQVTYISVTQNSRKKWTKKFRVSKVIDDRRVDDQRNYDFNEIGTEIFLDEASAKKALLERIEERKDSIIQVMKKWFGVK